MSKKIKKWFRVNCKITNVIAFLSMVTPFIMLGSNIMIFMGVAMFIGILIGVSIMSIS
jgi:hypothetical protein